MKSFLKFALLLVVLGLSTLTSGCLVDNTTLGVGNCFLGTSNCNGGNINPIGGPFIPGFTNSFKIQTVFVDARSPIQVAYDADSIPLIGKYIGNPTGEESLGGLPGFTDITAPITAPFPGLATISDVNLPGSWEITWVTSTQSEKAKELNFVQPTTGVPVDVCANNPDTTTIQPGQFIFDKCVVTVQSIDAGGDVNLASSGGPSGGSGPTVIPLAEYASDPVDLTVQTTDSFISGQVAVQIFDANGVDVACFGNGCYPVPLLNSYTLSIPAWGLAWADNNQAGYYYGQIETLQNGVWVNTDMFVFAITNGGQPVYRYYAPCTGRHYWSLLANDNPWPYCYNLEGIGYYTLIKSNLTYGNQGAELGFYKLYNPSTYSWLYSDDQQEITNAEYWYGFYDTGIIGNIMPYQTQYCNNGCVTDTIPLYRFRYANEWMFTISSDEFWALYYGGWTYEGVSGYVPTGQ